MSKTMLMTNEEVLTAAGVTAEEIAAIKTADADISVHTLDAIHKKLMAFVYEQRVEWANARNPFQPLERAYESFNGGSLNGFFSETLVPMRDKGDNNLYAGMRHVAGEVRNPYQSLDFGKEPLQYVYGINASIKRFIDTDLYDFLMFFRRGSMLDYVNSRIPLMEQEGIATREIIENNVINNERFQYDDYANVPVYNNAYDLQSFMYKIFDSGNYNSTNTEFKRAKFRTVRGSGDLVLIIKSEFWFDFAQRFQLSEYLKPFMYQSGKAGEFGVMKEMNRIIKVPELTPTTIQAGKVLDPLASTAATLPANTQLIGRIVDMKAIKFGIGMKTAASKMLDSRVQHFDQCDDYVFNMCDAYTNVPLLVSNDFKADRQFHVINDTPAARTTTK